MVDSKKSSSVDAKTYYQLGNDFYEKADYEKAIENYNMAILLNPIFSEAYFNRALCYYQLKNFDKSIVDYSKAAELDPPNSIIYNNRGDAYYRKQDFKEAVKDYDKAIQLNPNYLKAFYNRGLSYASLEEYEKAIEDFSKVIQLKEDFAEAYHLRGLCFEYANNLSTAIEDYEKALKLNPDLTEAKQHLEGAKAKQAHEGTKEGEVKAGSDIKMLQKPNMSFEDVAGMIKMKEEIRDTIVYPMINPELAKHYGKLGGGGILMYGPPGCGKCVSGDTPVLLSNGDLKPISALYEEAKCNSNEKRINENETIVENPDLEVLSFNRKTAKMERKRINFVYKQRYKGKLYEIVTHSGRRIEVTPEHPFISINNGKERDIVLLYSNSTLQDIAFRKLFDEAQKVGIKTHYVVTEKDGYIDDALIKTKVPDWKKRIYYVSGPQPMVDIFAKMLSKMKVAGIKTDFFPGYTDRHQK